MLDHYREADIVAACALGQSGLNSGCFVSAAWLLRPRLPLDQSPGGLADPRDGRHRRDQDGEDGSVPSALYNSRHRVWPAHSLPGQTQGLDGLDHQERDGPVMAGAMSPHVLEGLLARRTACRELSGPVDVKLVAQAQAAGQAALEALSANPQSVRWIGVGDLRCSGGPGVWRFETVLRTAWQTRVPMISRQT